jgi:hypothetical protein
MARPQLNSPARGPTPPALGPGTRFVDLDLAPAELFAVERADGVTGRLVVSHLDKAEPPRTTRIAIGDERDIVHFSMAGEKFVDFRLRRFKRKVADVDLHACISKTREGVPREIVGSTCVGLTTLEISSDFAVAHHQIAPNISKAADLKRTAIQSSADKQEIPARRDR